jgi:tRNA pseudouridine32 synthase/23S rRNA pseudouridine746 synthase
MNPLKIIATAPGEACSLLAQAGGLAKGRVKDAMTKGAAWLERKGQPARRLRRATTQLKPGERVILYYDADILAAPAPPPRCLFRHDHYSVWFKPAGLLAQGTLYGDHAALLRLAEQELQLTPYLAHRLDREAAGLMLLAHSGPAAERLSRLFRERKVDKRYRVTVLGDPGQSGVIDHPLDGKPARSEFKRLQYDAASDTAVLEVRIESGRKHQIRRHLEQLGHPVMGDPRYGRGNKNADGLQLLAEYLSFICPYEEQLRVFRMGA